MPEIDLTHSLEETSAIECFDGMFERLLERKSKLICNLCNNSEGYCIQVFLFIFYYEFLFL